MRYDKVFHAIHIKNVIRECNLKCAVAVIVVCQKSIPLNPYLNIIINNVTYFNEIYSMKSVCFDNSLFFLFQDSSEIIIHKRKMMKKKLIRET